MLAANFFYGSIILKSNKNVKFKNLDFVIKIISPKIEIKRFFENENSKIIISELVQLSKPNDNEKTIFIFPEGALTTIYLEDLKNYNYIFSENYSDQHKIIMGINSTEGAKVFNSMVVLDSSLNILAKYNKNNLVPFGEFLPFENFLNSIGLKKITPGYSSFSSGTGKDIINLKFDSKDINILPLICYEIIFPNLVDKQYNFNLIINISEDAWFGNSIGPHQHFAKAIFRSIESESYTIRSANKGISVFISPKGKILKNLQPDEIGNIELDIPINEKSKKQSKKDLIFLLLLITYISIFFILRKFKI